MTELRLDIYGARVRIAAEREALLEPLRRDFEFFAAADAPSRAPRFAPEGGEGGEVFFVLHAAYPPRALTPGGIPSLRTSEYSACDRGPVRSIRYVDGAVAVYDYALRRGDIHCANPMRLHELAYLAVLSRAGEDLDRRGYHRAHALGFERRGFAGLVLLPSGGGKSVLALEILKSSAMGLLSDDTPLLSPGGRALAFPLRWAFLPSADLSSVPPALVRPFHRRRHGPKRLVDLAHFRSRVRSDLPVRWLLLGARARDGRPACVPASRHAALGALAMNLVVGAGIAQMSEYMVRPTPSGALALARIAASRLRTALRLLRGVRPHRFLMGPDPAANLRRLTRFIDEPRDHGAEVRADTDFAPACSRRP